MTEVYNCIEVGLGALAVRLSKKLTQKSVLVEDGVLPCAVIRTLLRGLVNEASAVF